MNNYKKSKVLISKESVEKRELSFMLNGTLALELDANEFIHGNSEKREQLFLHHTI